MKQIIKIREESVWSKMRLLKKVFFFFLKQITLHKLEIANQSLCCNLLMASIELFTKTNWKNWNFQTKTSRSFQSTAFHRCFEFFMKNFISCTCKTFSEHGKTHFSSFSLDNFSIHLLLENLLSSLSSLLFTKIQSFYVDWN